MKRESKHASADYARIEQAIIFLRTSAPRQPSLREVAAAVHLSEFHLQRLFSRWAGISPKRFLQLLTLEHAKTQLADSTDVLSASLTTGLSGPGRLHDLFVSIEAVTPGEFKTRGKDVAIQYGFHPTPFGPCLLGKTGRGICYLEFAADRTEADMLEHLQNRWPGAALQQAQAETGRLVTKIFKPGRPGTASFNLLVRGTNFQLQVWNALLRIPPGYTTSYAEVARWIGKPGASRAVGNAVGNNPIAWLIPCHRVLRSDGHLGGYHWGTDRKSACLVWESQYASGNHTARAV